MQILIQSVLCWKIYFLLNICNLVKQNTNKNKYNAQSWSVNIKYSLYCFLFFFYKIKNIDVSIQNLYQCDLEYSYLFYMLVYFMSLNLYLGKNENSCKIFETKQGMQVSTFEMDCYKYENYPICFQCHIAGWYSS